MFLHLYGSPVSPHLEYPLQALCGRPISKDIKPVLKTQRRAIKILPNKKRERLLQLDDRGADMIQSSIQMTRHFKN